MDRREMVFPALVVGVLIGGGLCLFAGWMLEKTERYGRRYR